jgi:diazepam-binding inhibitor (GABA receptor modulator, acyl-CoA-binding protein)
MFDNELRGAFESPAEPGLWPLIRSPKAPSPNHTIHLETIMTLQAEFDQALADSKNLPERPDNMTLLKIYALFKQASSGDADGKRPGFTDMIARAKWDAWDALKGTSKEDAMQQYVDLINELKG